MKPIETVLQSQRKMYDFDNNPLLGKEVIDDPDVAYDMEREEKREREEKELDFVEAYREETYDGYIVNLENQLGRKLNPDEKEDADLMYDELTFKYTQ